MLPLCYPSAQSKFNPIAESKCPALHPSTRNLEWDEPKDEAKVLNIKVRALTLLNGSLSLTGTLKHTRAISKWTRDEETKPIWKITFASGAQITDNLFMAPAHPVLTVGLKCASTKLRERWTSLEDKENIIKSVTVK